MEVYTLYIDKKLKRRDVRFAKYKNISGDTGRKNLSNYGEKPFNS